jgi:outer membrane protein
MTSRIRVSLIAALVVGACSAPAFAQISPGQPPPPGPAGQNPTPRGQSREALTLKQAQQMALSNHPQIQMAMNRATYAQQEARETRSAYYPVAVGNVTAVDSQENSRITAGALNSPHVFTKYGNGFAVNQLLTDFGHTQELVKSSSLHAQAQQERVATSREDVLLGVDRAYFGVLKSQALLRVAEETVKERQFVTDQVITEAKNQLKSGLDVSFAQVNLSQAQLLLIQAQNNLEASYAELSTALGYAEPRTFQLAEEPLPGQPPADWSQLIEQALRERPELISQRLDVNSAESYATAERDLWFPTVSAAGVAGLTPIQGTGLDSARYAAAGVNVNIPIFNGHLFDALRGQAQAETRVQQQYLRDLTNSITRDVRTAWLDAQSAYQDLSVTEQLLEEAEKALNLAQARYKLGLSSIVELTQAQLNETSAEISEASAKYDYQIQMSVLDYQIGALR